MKELKVVGVDGNVIHRSTLKLKGPDYRVIFDIPIIRPLRSITLVELEKKDQKTKVSQPLKMRNPG